MWDALKSESHKLPLGFRDTLGQFGEAQATDVLLGLLGVYANIGIAGDNCGHEAGLGFRLGGHWWGLKERGEGEERKYQKRLPYRLPTLSQ